MLTIFSGITRGVGVGGVNPVQGEPAGDSYTAVSWTQIRDGVVYIKKTTTAPVNATLSWVDVYNADATPENIYVQNPDGKTLQRLDVSSTSGSTAFSLAAGVGIYRIEIPGPTARAYTVGVNGPASVFEPVKVHQSLSVAAGLTYYLFVPSGAGFNLCGKMYAGAVSALTLTNAANGADVHTLSMSVQPYYQDYQTLAVAPSGSDRIFALTYTGSGRLAVWVDGIPNHWSLHQDQLFTVNHAAGAATITVQGSVGIVPKLGATLPYNAISASAEALAASWGMTSTSAYHFQTHLTNNPGYDEPFLALRENTLGLAEYSSTIRVDPTIITDTSATITFYNTYLAARDAAGYLQQTVTAFADEPNLNYSDVATFNAQYITIATAIKGSSNPAISSKQLGFPQSSRFSRGPTTDGSINRRGYDQADSVLASNWPLVDAVTWHEWQVRDLLATDWYYAQINDAWALQLSHKPVGQPDKKLIISQTNMSSGDSVSQYEQGTFFACLWWISVVCHATRSGKLSALIWFPAFSDEHHEKGLADVSGSATTARLISDAMTFATSHVGVTALSTTSNHPEVVSVATRSAAGALKILGVNVGKRSQTITLVLPSTVTTATLHLYSDGYTSSTPLNVAGTTATFGLNAETIFAIDEPDPLPVPLAPTNLTATALGSSSIRVEWSDTSNNETGFSVEASDSASSGYAEIISVGPGITAVTETGIASETTRYYRVRAFNEAGNSGYSNVDSATTTAPAAGQRTISGSGFGGGPTVFLFDRAEGVPGAAYSTTADIGQWSGINTATVSGRNPRYVSANGRTWLSGRESDQLTGSTSNVTSMRYEHPTVYTEYYSEYRLLIPDGYNVPGSSTPNDKNWTSTQSRWKIRWGWIRAYGAGAVTDCCFPTMNSTSLQILGNAVQPRQWTGAAWQALPSMMAHFSAVNENLLGHYVSGEESTPGAHDATAEIWHHNGTSLVRSIYAGVMNWWRGIEGAALPQIGEDTFVLPGWSGNVDQTNVFHLYADMYHAVGVNSRARIYCHNQPTINASTQVHNVPRDSWSDTEIKISPNEREALPYVSYYTADGVLHENVSWI